MKFQGEFSGISVTPMSSKYNQTMDRRLQCKECGTIYNLGTLHKTGARTFDIGQFRENTKPFLASGDLTTLDGITCPLCRYGGCWREGGADKIVNHIHNKTIVVEADSLKQFKELILNFRKNVMTDVTDLLSAHQEEKEAGLINGKT